MSKLRVLHVIGGGEFGGAEQHILNLVTSLPQEAVDRISELLIPGSSLLVSDQAASGETGAGTDFIVLTR